MRLTADEMEAGHLRGWGGRPPTPTSIMDELLRPVEGSGQGLSSSQQLGRPSMVWVVVRGRGPWAVRGLEPTVLGPRVEMARWMDGECDGVGGAGGSLPPPASHLLPHPLLRYLCDKVVPGNRVTIMGIYSIKKFGLTASRGRDRVGVGIRSSYIRVLGIQVDTDGSGECALGRTPVVPPLGCRWASSWSPRVHLCPCALSRTAAG